MSTGETCSAECYSPEAAPEWLSPLRVFKNSQELRDLFQPRLNRKAGEGKKLGETSDEQESFEELWRQQLRKVQRKTSGEVNTLYKRVGEKVRPVDTPRQDQPMDLGREDWKQRAIAPVPAL